MARSTTPDYYELLGVPRDADTETITKAYRKLARVSHPDGGGNAGMFRLLRVAYETLTDETQRTSYDAALDKDTDTNAGSPRGHGTEQAAGHREQPRDGSAAGPGGGSAAGPGGGSGSAAGPGTGSAAGTVDDQERPYWQFDDGTARSMVVDPERLSWWSAVDPELPAVVEPPYSKGRLPALAAATVFGGLGVAIVAFHLVGVIPLVTGAGLFLASYLRGSYGMEVTAVAGVAGAVAVVSTGVYMYVAKPTSASLLGFGLLLSLAAGAVLFHRLGQATALNRLASSDAIDQREYGRPGAGRLAQESARQFGDRVGADALLPLTFLPGVRVFHGLTGFDDEAVFSHAVVCDRLVALVESVCWEPGRYTWTPHGSLMRNGQHFAEGELGLDDAVATYRQALGGEVDVRGFVLVAPTGVGTVSGGVGPTGVLLGDPQTVVDEIGTWFLRQGSIERVDRNLLVRLNRCRAPAGADS